MRYKILIILIIVGLGVLMIRFMPTSPSHTIEGLFYPKTKPIPPFQLATTRGVFTQKNLKNQWSLLFFGYTYCPDICPVTLSMLSQMKVKLTQLYPQFAKNTQFVFISVDSQRDTPEKLAEYVQFFDNDFIGVTGTIEQIKTLTRQLGIVFIKKPGNTEDDYLIDHSAQILLVNPQGQWAGIFSAPHEAENLTHHYAQMRQYLQEHPYE